MSSVNYYKADLHIHTCLSPCADLDMTPLRIINAAVARGLQIIAISDHNSAENTAVAVATGIDHGITVLPAMELTSQEEAHVLALFDSAENILAMQEIIYGSLQSGVNDEIGIGYQLVVNELDEILDYNKRLLIGATSLSLGELVRNIHSFGGIAIASHIDRHSFSVLSQLGFIPDDVAFDALEISYSMGMEEATSRFGSYKGIPWLTSSDAHSLGDVGRKYTTFLLQEPSFSEISLALKGEREMRF
ncbi:MAG: PHP domain-containing protein [Nitrospirae bacterium]|nr:PHP domain-containing protein [Nitrospirota bacterium]